MRRINKSTTLSVMDSVVLAIKAGITLTVPSTAEDGQFYWIRNTSNDKVYIAGTRLVGWESGEISSSMYLMASSATAMYYDKHNNIWFMNWIGFGLKNTNYENRFYKISLLHRDKEGYQG